MLLKNVQRAKHKVYFARADCGDGSAHGSGSMERHLEPENVIEWIE